MTGLAPFELVFGRNVKGPLDLLKCSWLEGEVEHVELLDWVDKVRGRMLAMAEVVTDRDKKAKADMKRLYDRSAKEKLLKLGVSQTRKLEEVWEGPYEVGAKLSQVNYRVEIPGKTGGKVVHVNLLKKVAYPI